jgi:hypothetical protein
MYIKRKEGWKKERKNQRNKQMKKGKNISVYVPEDIQMTDTWTRHFHFLHTVNFLTEKFTYTEDERRKSEIF